MPTTSSFSEQDHKSCSGKSGTPSQPYQSCFGKSGKTLRLIILLRKISKPFQHNQSCSDQSGKPPSLINPAQTNQAIRQPKEIH